MALPRSLRTYH